ncbi:unnamed protein product [Heterobilharzia americana]|nr:unnamed protein product [Heterobilharzia americana]
MGTKNVVVLSICDKKQEKALIVQLRGSLSYDNLFQIVRKHLKLTSQCFDLEYLQKNIGPCTLSKFGKLENNFEVDKQSELDDGASLPPPIVTSLLHEMLDQIPLRNRLEVKILPSSDDESQQPTSTSNSDDGSVIGLSCMENGESEPYSMQPLNTCTAIVLSDPSSREGYTSVNSTLSENTTDHPVAQTFVGLVNSGMTCYMNSLLQTLFMTPEFRNALYHWHFEGTSTEAVTSIPYQLQRLFVQLQTTKSTAISTNGVTTSFGWRSCDIIQQQDIHELCRILFDALEKKLGYSKSSKDKNHTGNSCLGANDGDHKENDAEEAEEEDEKNDDKKKTSSSTFNLINRLYQGQRSDYVRCLYCNRVSWRPDTFLDIQVPLRSFELNAKPYESLEAAFRALIKPERLEGSNQYWCSYCECKRDAERGCAFHKMPYLLTLQLMRFTFDPITLNRIKLNDKFTFPLDRLDLSEFVTPSESNESSGCNGDTEENGKTSENDDTRAHSEDGLMCSHSSIKTDTQENPQNNCISTATNDNIASLDNCSESMETEATDSGVNSNTDSPFDGVSSGSPTVGSPNVEEEIDELSDFGVNPTHTVTNSSVLMKAVLSVQKNMNETTGNINMNSNDNNNNNHTNETFKHAVYSSNELDDGIASECTCPSCSHSSTTHQIQLTNECHSRKQRRHRSLSPQHCSPQKFNPSKIVNGNNHHNDDDGDNKPQSKLETKSHSSNSLIYELFSIMVHSGSINGGHYYAFIKSFTDGRWYKFNDQHVIPTNLEALEATFGTTQSTYLSHSNAYFLMYRRVDPELNETFLNSEDFPEHIKQMIQELHEEEKDAAEKKERELMMCNFEAYTRCPTEQAIIHADVTLYKNQSLSEATDIIRRILLPRLNNEPTTAFRIVQYHGSDETLGKSAEYVLHTRSRSLSYNNGFQFYNEEFRDSDSSTSSMNTVTVGEFSDNKRFYPFCLWLEHRINVPGSIRHFFPCTSQEISHQWRTYEPGGITFKVNRVDLSSDLIYPSEKIWMSFSGTIKELISEVWQLYTGKILSDDDLKTGPADGLKLILDQSSCHWQIEPLSLLSQQNEVYGLPQWAVVLYSGDHSFPWNTIIDYSFDSVINFSNHFNGIYGKSFTSITGGSVNLYVDLGRLYDGYCDESHDCSESNVLNTSNSSTLISNSNNSTEISHNGRDVGGKRENVTIPSDKDINWRLRKICSLTEKRLYYMIFPLIIPSQTEIASFLVQRELLIKGSLGDDSTQFLDSSMSTPQSLYNVTVPNSNKHEAIGSPPISSMKSSGSLDNGISSKNQFDGSVNSMSPPDSRCSINAQYGSLPSEKSVSSSSSCSSSFNKVSAENLNILRRSNSQPSLSPFTEPLSSACISSPILQSKSIKLNASLVAMDVDNISEHHPSLSYLQSNDIPMESNTTFNELNTSQRLCQFEEFCKPDSRVSAKLSSPIWQIIQLNIDTRLTVEEFKEKAGEYLNLDAEFLNVSVEPDGGYISKDFTTLSSTDSLRISLSPCISLEEVYLSFYVLDLEGEPKEEDGEKQQQTMDTATYELNHTNLKRSSPIWSHQINLLYRLGWSVEQLLKCASSVFKRIHNLNIPLSQLRLRKCGLPDLTPGPIFSETDVLTTFTNQHQGLMLQLISEKHTHNIVSTAIDNYSDTSNPISYNNKPRTCSLFLRQWHPSSYSFDAWHELILTYHPVTSTRWDMLVKWLVQHTGLSSDRLEVAQYKFPGAIHSLNICPLITVYNGYPVPSTQILYYHSPVETWYFSEILKKNQKPLSLVNFKR